MIKELSKLREQLSDKISTKKILENQLVDFKKDREEKYILLEDLKTAQSIFQEAANITQAHLSFHIESIVSQALATVFEDPYEFRCRFVTRRNMPECDLFLHKDGKDFSNPLDSCGYGVVDIVSLALRVAYWKLDEKVRDFIALDEPLRNLSKIHQTTASFMLKELSSHPDLKLQFLVVSHNEELTEYADKIFGVTYKNKRSKIKELVNV